MIKRYFQFVCDNLETDIDIVRLKTGINNANSFQKGTTFFPFINGNCRSSGFGDPTGISKSYVRVLLCTLIAY